MMLKKVSKSLEEAVMFAACRASFNLKYKFHKQVTYQIYDKNTNIYIIRSYNKYHQRFTRPTYGGIVANVSIRILSTLFGEQTVTPGKSISHTG